MRPIKYMVPSLFTFGSILCGTYVVVNAISGLRETADHIQAVAFFVRATQAIGLAIILDNIDGRLARKIGATTQFGMELDSIADALTFGGATAVLVYSWGYDSRFELEVIIVSFIFVACGAARLARSNLRSHSLQATATSEPREEERYFVGLPIPAAAGLIAAIVYFSSAQAAQSINGTASRIPSFYLLSIVLLLALLMVSTFPYSKLKIRYRRRKSLSAFLNFLVFPTLALLISVVVWCGLRWFVLMAAVLYVAHGPICAIRFSRRPQLSHLTQDRRKENGDYSRTQESIDSQLLPR